MTGFRNLLSFSTIAAAINFLASFALAYIYDPEDFGSFAYIFAFSNILSGFLFWRADFLVAKSRYLEKYAYSILVYTTVLIALVMLLVSLVLARTELLIVIVWGAVISLSSLISYMAINRGNHLLIGYARLANAVSITSLQLSFSFIEDINGLIFGSVLGSALVHVFIFYKITKNNFRWLTLHKTFIVLRKNFKRSFSTTISWFFDALILSLLPILVNYKFGPVIAGYYVFADRIIKSPVSVLTSTISPLFISYINNVNAYLKLKLLLFKYFISISILILATKLFLGDIVADLIVFLWGDKWVKSSVIVEFVIIYHLSYMYNISTMYFYHHFNIVNKYVLIQGLYFISVVLLFLFFDMTWVRIIEISSYFYMSIFILNFTYHCLFLLFKVKGKKN
ncbi:oligosaccharide flippase family protein [Pseudoalteromonas arctica]|uniref:oligosaccharide flippase family protein n=1 Tax=Pseudoalteromonas arctica TaxID=394751 RepID=UPI00145C1D1D|nr:oligosaccharide flippase family protein [Pseudoalteromonas arctica]NMP80904.1 oligosaccharide flippase family protein [Pseudoalteromonas arctica]